MATINKKRLAVYKKKGYSSALEYRIDLLRDAASLKYKTIDEYVAHIRKTAKK